MGGVKDLCSNQTTVTYFDDTHHFEIPIQHSVLRQFLKCESAFSFNKESLGFRGLLRKLNISRNLVESFTRRSYHAQDGDGSGAGLHGEAAAAGGQTRHSGPCPGLGDVGHITTHRSALGPLCSLPGQSWWSWYRSSASVSTDFPLCRGP